MIEVLTVFVGIFLAQISPGPNMMAVASASLGSGRGAGVATALGVASGVIVWSLLFSIGVGAFLQAFPQTLIDLRLIGGGYLLFIGLKALRRAVASDEATGRGPQLQIATKAAYRRGVLVVLTNPKAALMWVAVSMYLASTHFGAWAFMAIGFGASLSAACVYSAYACLFSTGVAVRGYRRFFRLIEGSFGMMFGAFGARLIFDGIREVRPA